jgi:hypothetical protein
MKILSVISILFLIGCVTTASIVNASPGFIVIEAPRESGCGQQVTDMAQEHCAKEGKDAVLIDGTIKPFVANYCRYECKK